MFTLQTLCFGLSETSPEFSKLEGDMEGKVLYQYYATC